MAKRPLIHSEPVSEFGAALPEDGVTKGRDVDLLYVPGYSDMVRQRAVELIEYTEGTRHGKDVSTLPVRCQWVAITRGASDKPDSVKKMKFANDGYEPVTASMVGKQTWLTAIPPGAKQLPDGSIVNAAGDLQLFYCSAAKAAQNQARLQRENQAQMDSLGGNLGDGPEGLYSAGKAPGFTDVKVERGGSIGK